MKFLTTDYSSSATVGRYRIDAERRMRIEEYQGKTGLADLKAIISSMTSDPCWSPDFHGLIDFSDAELELTANDVLRLALVLRHEENRSRGWLAFVANNSTAYGIVRMLGYWSRNTDRLRIFQNRDEAEAWLERNIDQVPPGFIEENGSAAAAVLRNVV
ncbi:MAG: hypothetical protein ABIS50_05830 [Luteolibacter sp.]|uniref:hypothetical protein n=1 Tax=Luteolibacter sp. TaxID=1962973 RepID=UPI0032630775